MRQRCPLTSRRDQRNRKKSLIPGNCISCPSLPCFCLPPGKICPKSWSLPLVHIFISRTRPSLARPSVTSQCQTPRSLSCLSSSWVLDSAGLSWAFSLEALYLGFCSTELFWFTSKLTGSSFPSASLLHYFLENGDPWGHSSFYHQVFPGVTSSSLGVLKTTSGLATPNLHLFLTPLQSSELKYSTTSISFIALIVYLIGISTSICPTQNFDFFSLISASDFPFSKMAPSSLPVRPTSRNKNNLK